MIVVDTNVLAQLVVVGDRTAVIRRVQQRDDDWIAPPLWRGELQSVLGGCLRRGAMTLGDALKALDVAAQILRHRERRPPSERVLVLVQSSRCSAYDCEFVALAEQLDCRLVTCDREVLAAFPTRAVTPEAFAGP